MPQEDHGDVRAKALSLHEKNLQELVDNFKTVQWPSGDRSPILSTGDDDLDRMLRMCVDTVGLKGKEYTVGSPDRLANFRQVAQDSGIKMEQAWSVFANKHYRAIQSYIKNDCKVLSEPIAGRIMDLIVYLLLFYKMTLEIESRQKTERLSHESNFSVVESFRDELMKKGALDKLGSIPLDGTHSSDKY